MGEVVRWGVCFDGRCTPRAGAILSLTAKDSMVMALPKAREAQLFYRSAKQRYDDAQFLLEGKRTTGAGYLAGYSDECILKALILERIPRKQRAEMLESFRGAKAHDFH